MTTRPTERADALVMLGITGDLGEKQLFPALVELAVAGRLGVPVVGVGRTERSDDDLRELVRGAAADIDGASSVVDTIDIRYAAGDATEQATFDAVADRLAGCERVVVSASLPPDTFGAVARCLADSGLPDTTRLVVEKPFGTDAEDARRLHDEITERIDPERLFVVDHFLAKAAVENLLTFRAANPMIDAAMRAGPVARVEVSMLEAFGVDGRERFYDGVGAIADVVQNHLLQLVAVLAMETPEDDSAAAFDAARAAVLGAIVPVAPADAVLGQFRGYRDADDVAAGSATETYAAMRLSIDTPRWRDVPFLLRTGKRLAGTATEAVVVFDGGTTPNRLRFGFKPDSAIELELGVLEPEGHEVRPTTLVACGPDRHGGLGDYATVLDGALAGDHRHFARVDGIEAAWRVVERVRAVGIDPIVYDTDTMGPPEADHLVDGGWVTPRPLEAPDRSG